MTFAPLHDTILSNTAPVGRRLRPGAPAFVTMSLFSVVACVGRSVRVFGVVTVNIFSSVNKTILIFQHNFFKPLSEALQFDSISYGAQFLTNISHGNVDNDAFENWWAA